MAKLHELLGAEKTVNIAWSELLKGTIDKFGKPQTFFEGHSKTLSMSEEGDAARKEEQAAREEKNLVTNVYDTLVYALDIYGRTEDLQFQKNSTNRNATGTIMWKGAVLIDNVPVDELLGLEARLGELRKVMLAMPTLDASKHWERDTQQGQHVWMLKFPEETTKTRNTTVPLVLHPPTKEHPAQTTTVQVNAVVGKFSTQRYSGAATARQKADAIRRIDELLLEVKQARTRANETTVEKVSISKKLLPLLLEPLQSESDASSVG